MHRNRRGGVTPAGHDQTHHPLRAALIMLGACALLAGTTLIAKMLGNDFYGPPLHPLQVSAGRFAFALCTLLIVAPFLRLSFENTPWRLHFMRSLAGWLGVSCMFAAAAQIPLADATAISFLSPIATMVLAIPLLGERIGRIRWSAAGISVIGAMILIRPGTDAFHVGALIALLAACLMGLEAIFIKRLSGSDRTIRILFINNAIGATLAVTAASFVWVSPTPAQWGLLITLGIVMVSAQTCFILAMKSADASYVVPFMYGTLVFAAVYDFVLFSVIPASLSILGAAIIVAGALFLAFRERQRSQSTARAGK